MNVFGSTSTPLLVVGALLSRPVGAADLILSANDGKDVRVEGVSTYPQPPPPTASQWSTRPSSCPRSRP